MGNIDVNALGQAMDTTWGRSSTPRTASYSVKLTMLGTDRVSASYAAVVNFGSQKQMIEMKRRYADEAKAVIAAVVKHVRDSYKSLTGENLTVKELDGTDTLEIINMNVHNPRRTAYYRRKAVFEIA